MTATRKRTRRAPSSFAGKTKTIQLRAKAADQRLIDNAAELTGKNRTDFMIQSAVQEAQKVLFEQRFFGLEPSAWEQLTKILDAPVQKNPKLANLMQQPAPWER